MVRIAIIPVCVPANFCGYREAAGAIEAAASAVIKAGCVTRDLGGNLATLQAGEAVRAELKRL